MSATTFQIVKNLYDTSFSEKYKELWDNSLFKSPFTGLEFFKLLGDFSKETIGFTQSQNEKMTFAVFLKKDSRGDYIFLGDGFADHNIITTHKESSEQELIDFLELVLCHLKGNIYLKNIPNWQFDKSAWEKAVLNTNKKQISFFAWKNPIFSVEKNQESYQEIFHKNFKKSRLTTYYNKLKKTPGFEFEIDESDNNLDNWVEDFCMNHESRWNLTTTPSEYVSKYRREILKKRMKSFHLDQTLIRFSFSINGRLIGSVICLKSNDYILYSSPSFSLMDEQTHSSQALICQIGQWAALQGYTVFDFGVGDEHYKLRFANQVEDFSRMYIPIKKWNIFHIKSEIEKGIRENSLLKAFYDKYILDLLRHKLAFQISKFKTKFTLVKRAYKNDKNFVVNKFIQSFQKKLLYFKYERNLKIETENFDIKVITYYQFVEFLESDGPITLKNRNVLIQGIVTKNKMPFGLFKDGELLSVAIVTVKNEVMEFSGLVLENAQHRVITDCYTTSKNRGKGYYPTLISMLGNKLTGDNFAVYIYTYEYNKASINGILKAGFVKI